jgi:proto-oncogene tyrosine-protein kinase ROS
LDIAEQRLFVAEENGCIYQSSLNFTKINDEKREVICQKSGLNFKPSLLSVDWLNKHLYILGEMFSISNSPHQSSWSISRCDFEGKNLIVAFGGINEKPLHMEVDPYNGYDWLIN